MTIIADEIQTGFGRTGAMFAIEEYGIEPDLMTLAKSLAAGLPLSAVVGRADILDAPGPGGIGGICAGNPVACAAALAVLDLFDQHGIVEQGRALGALVSNRFASLAGNNSLVGEARGLGAMQAIVLVLDRTTKKPATALTADIMHACHDKGLLLIKAGQFDNVLRFSALWICRTNC